MDVCTPRRWCRSWQPHCLPFLLQPPKTGTRGPGEHPAVHRLPHPLQEVPASCPPSRSPWTPHPLCSSPSKEEDDGLSGKHSMRTRGVVAGESPARQPARVSRQELGSVSFRAEKQTLEGTRLACGGSPWFSLSCISSGTWWSSMNHCTPIPSEPRGLTEMSSRPRVLGAELHYLTAHLIESSHPIT